MPGFIMPPILYNTIKQTIQSQTRKVVANEKHSSETVKFLHDVKSDENMPQHISLLLLSL